MTLEIRLDPPQGEPNPHWLLYYYPARLRAWWRRWLNDRRDEAESRAFYRKHGPIVKIEPMPRQRRKPRPKS